MIPLLQLAQQAVYELGYQGEHHTQRALYHVIQVTKRLNYDILRNMRPAELPVPVSRLVKFPENMVGLVRIGAMVQGRFVAFTEDKSLSLVPGSQPGSGRTSAIGSVHNGQHTGRVFGGIDTGSIAGSYRVDHRNRQVVLGPDVAADSVYMEYITTGIEATAETQVHAFAEETILAYVLWKMVAHKPNVPLGEKQLREGEFKRQNILLSQRMSGITKAGLMKALRSGYTQTAKN